MLRTEMLGRLGQDPEVRYTPKGDAVCNFSLAHSDRWKDRDTGETKERTEWVRFVAFGRQAEIIGQYAKKGDQLWCAGQQQTRSYEKDGQTRYTTEIKVREFEFVGSRGDSNSQGNEPPPPADDFDDDIPF